MAMIDSLSVKERESIHTAKLEGGRNERRELRGGGYRGRERKGRTRERVERKRYSRQGEREYSDREDGGSI